MGCKTQMCLTLKSDLSATASKLPYFHSFISHVSQIQKSRPMGW